MSAERILFTGNALEAFGRSVDATCLVRNVDENGWRGLAQVVETMGSTRPLGVKYQPRRFPPGTWRVTGAAQKGQDTAYWPWYIATDAWQLLEEWSVDEKGRYLEPTGRTFAGRGYGLHFARHRTAAGLMVASNTTLGCINVLDNDDARWLGMMVSRLLAGEVEIRIEVPEWGQWKEAA